jgi:hypothetical protein
MNLAGSLAASHAVAAPVLEPKRFSRALVPGDHEVAHYVLTGLKRRLYLLMYVALVATALAGTAYTFWYDPLFGAAALALGYVIDNLCFTYGHLEFHAAFIEVPEHKMSTLFHSAFIHHYRRITVFHEHWLEVRLSYFVDPRPDFSLIATVMLLPIAVGFLALAYVLSPVLAIAWFSAQTLPKLLQSVVHEWYHNPRKNRKIFYSRPMYAFFTLLEKVGLASTSDHARHHLHGLNNMQEVDRWLDLYIPFGELLPERVWEKAVSLYEPGKTRMSEYIARVRALTMFIHRGVFLGLLVALYWLV